MKKTDFILIGVVLVLVIVGIVSSKGTETLEEIEFPLELLKNAKEADLFIFENGEYKKYIQ